MTKLDARVTMDTTVTLVINEAEAAALDALAGYGSDAFLKVFYKELGQSYMQPHEVGLRSLFAAIREQIPSVLREVQECRQFVAEARSERLKERAKR